VAVSTARSPSSKRREFDARLLIKPFQSSQVGQSSKREITLPLLPIPSLPPLALTSRPAPPFPFPLYVSHSPFPSRYPFPHPLNRLGGMASVVSSPSGVRGETPDASGF
jgi:hypothetical protein